MSDLELIVNGKALDLNEGTVVSMVFNNTLLDSEVLQGSYSLPFNLPDTAKNRIALGFLGVIENVADMLIEIDCQLRYEVVVINAKMKIWDYTKKGYSVNLQTDIGAIAEKLKTVKINELDLETVPLPLETRETISTSFRQIGAIVDGARINFRFYRQDLSGYIFSVVWGGSISTFLANLVSRITTPQPVVPNFADTTTYQQFDLVRDVDGNYWECQYDNITGKIPKYSTSYDSGTPYVVDDLVYEGLGIYEAIQPSTGVPVTDTDYWYFVGENEYWFQICNAAGWPAAWRSGTPIHWWKYDDPYYPFDLDAEFFESTLYIYDEAVSAADLDYILIWSQTITNLEVEPGLQNLGSTDYETNFRLPINRMLDKQVGKKWPETNYVFIPYLNPLSFDDSLVNPGTPTREYINYFVNGNYQYGAVTLESVNKQFFVPQVAVGHLLRKLFDSLGVGYNDEMFLGSPEGFDRLQIYNSRAAVKYVRQIGGLGFFTFPFEIKLKDHLPPVLLGEFINALRQFLFLGFVFDQATKTFKVVRLKDVVTAGFSKDWTEKAVPEYRMEREDPQGFTLSYTHDSGDEKVKKELPDISSFVINPEVPDLASLPATIEEVGKLRLVTEKEAFYLASWTDANTVIWNLYCRYLVPLKIDAGKTSRKPSISTVLDQWKEDAAGVPFGAVRNWQIPSVEQKLWIQDLNLVSQFTLRIFFNWGFQPDSEGQDYPFGSSQNVNYAGTELGSLSLRYDTDSGIVNRLGKEWLQFLADTKKVYRSVRLNSADILSLAQDDTIRVDRVDYLWKQCKITFPIRKPAEFEFWKKN